MNTQERSFYNNVTGFSPSAIKRIFKKQSTNEVKFWILKAELGKELMKARDYYNSDEGKNEMDDAGITYNDICEFFQSIAGGRKKSVCYKLIKAANNVDANENAINEFVTACDEAEENGESPKRNIEAFNKFCTSGEAEVRESEETESEETEEAESEENQSEDPETYITISMKAINGNAGATIRIDADGNVIQSDGSIRELCDIAGRVLTQMHPLQTMQD